MEELEELFKILSAMYEGISHKKLMYDDFMAILPKLKIVRKHLPLNGVELIKLIDELMVFKSKKVLEKIDDETVDLVKKLYYGELQFGILGLLSPTEILKHILLPYRTNTCTKEKEIYIHIAGFEFLLDLMAKTIDKNNKYQQEIIRKNNSELFELLMHYYLCIEKAETTQKTIICSALVNAFGLFYFKQDDYDNDYSLLDSITNNIVENKEIFIDYCDKEGIKELFFTPEDYKSTYTAINKLIDESYNVKKEKRK